MSNQEPKRPVQSPDVYTMFGTIMREVAAINAKQDTLYRMQVDGMKEVLVYRDKQDRLARRVEKVEHQLALVSAQPAVPDWSPDPMDRTGSHNIAHIQQQIHAVEEKYKIDEQRRYSSWQWNKRTTILLAAGFISSLIVAACGGGAALALQGLKSPPAADSKGK